MAVLRKTLSDLMMSPTVHFHHLPNGEPHVHERVSAKSHPGHRVIAVCGKGGVGKTAFSAMAAHSLMHREDAGRLLVIDADPAFGLAYALGLPTEPNIATVREALLAAARSGEVESERELARELDYMVFESLVETEGFAFLSMGRSRDLGCYCAVNDLLRDAVELLVNEFDTVLIDGEAGLEQINRQVVASVDDLIVVSDGSLRGWKTVTSVVEMAAEHGLVPEDRIHLVLNRQDGQVDVEALRAHGSPNLLGVIPADAELASFDRSGKPLTSLPHENEASHAVWHIIDRLMGFNAS